MMKVHFLKFLDFFFGSFLVRFLSRTSNGALFYRPNRVLIIRPGGIGDAALLIPAITTFKIYYPDATIDILAEKRNSDLFLLCSHIDKILRYDIPKELFMAIRGPYDIVIDSEQWHRLSTIVARLTCSPMSIGYSTNERKKLFTHSLPYSHDDYELHSFLHLLMPLSVPLSIDLEKPFLTVPADSTEKVLSLLKKLSNNRIAALFPGGSIPERRWGIDRFKLTAKALVEHGYNVIVIGGRNDRKAGKKIVSGLTRVENFCGRLSLVETAAVLKESALLITGDSGIMHVGFGLGIKTLSLFGPGIEKKWAPRGQGHVVINKNLDCSPCTKFGYTPKCKKNAECMRRISADEVIAKALELLEG